MVKDAAGNEVPDYKTLIDPESFQVAYAMKHGKTGEALIKYYVPENKNGLSAEVKAAYDESPLSGKWQKALAEMLFGNDKLMNRLGNAIEIVRDTAPGIEPITNAKLCETINKAVADINSKMIGIIRLIPANSPTEADITISSIQYLDKPASSLAEGQYTIVGRTIGFKSKKLVLISDVLNESILRVLPMYVVTHEMGHALGLWHPHDSFDSKPMSTQLPCIETAMAYYEKCVGNSGSPSENFGKLDIEALKKIYADRMPPATVDHGLPPAASANEPAATFKR